MLFPPGLRSKNKSIIFIFAFSISPLINLSQRILLNLMDITYLIVDFSTEWN